MTTENTATATCSLTRRAFVLSATAAASVGLYAGDAKPLLTIGAMTDNHLHAKRPATHRRTKACFDLFRRENVDIVVDTGDIADRSDLGELAFCRTCFDDAFAGTACVPFFCIANHDYNYVPGTGYNDPKNIENAWKALGMDCANPTAVVNGYRFVNVFQQNPDPNAFAKAVARAVAESPAGRPVFVVNHVPPALTTAETVHWSSQHIRDVLNKYPQVVVLTGHNHASIAKAANIWQGEFTAVNLGAQAEYSNKIEGEATVLSVYADRIDIRRYEAVSGREIGADDRWSIPLPLDPAHGPYRPEVRAKACPVASLPADAKVRFEQNGHGSGGKLVFPAAEPRNTASHYRFVIESQQPDGTWKFLTTIDWSTPQTMDEPALQTAAVSPALLDAGRPHRVTITPLNSFDVAGASRTFPFAVPAQPMQLLPAEITRFESYRKSTKRNSAALTPAADGWLEKSGGMLVAALPRAFTAAVVGKKAVSLVLDIASDQQNQPNTFTVARLPAGGGEPDFYCGGGRIYTQTGRLASCRYAWTFHTQKPAPDDEYALVIREGQSGRFKINGAKAFWR